jgi:hypothetical protein
MAEASQDSRPSDGKRGATPNARRYPRTDPAKFTHIADRWPRRCAQGRRGGAASNGGRLAMKRATSSPLAKDAASLSIFAEIARLIAGPDTSQWLPTHFKRWASSLMLDRFVESALRRRPRWVGQAIRISNREQGSKSRGPMVAGQARSIHARWPL